MTEDPVDHVAAITRARRADAIAIDERVAPQHIGDAVHQIDVDLATPVATDLIYKLLTITSRATRVRRKHNVTRVRKHLRVPAIAPVVVPRALWSTVNQHHERILLTRIEICSASR